MAQDILLESVCFIFWITVGNLTYLLILLSPLGCRKCAEYSGMHDVVNRNVCDSKQLMSVAKVKLGLRGLLNIQ